MLSLLCTLVLVAYIGLDIDSILVEDCRNTSHALCKLNFLVYIHGQPIMIEVVSNKVS